MVSAENASSPVDTKKKGDSSLQNAIAVLETISTDTAVPKNVRKNAKDIIARLDNGTQPFQVRLNSTMQLLDEMSNDPNIPLHTRTQLWQIASLLEAAGKARSSGPTHQIPV